MLCEVDCFYKTNFDTVNIPINLTFLTDHFAHKTFPSLDILQLLFLGYIDIRATEKDVRYCDYVRLRTETTQDGEQEPYYHRALYAVQDFTMLSGDTARLFLAFDAVTTFGGMSSLDISGVTSRISVMEWQEKQYLGSTEEVFFENGDPLMAPSDPILVTFATVDARSPQAQGQGGNFIESTIDLATLGASGYSDGKAYVDQTAQTYTTFPKLPPAQSTQYSFVGGGIQLSRQTGLFKDTGLVKDGLMAARACGVEGSIINQVEIPSNYISAAVDSSGRVTSMQGVRGETAVMDTGIVDNYSSATDLKRLHYGDYCKIGLATATGASFEARVEELYYKSGHLALVQYMVDARPDGAPYYKLCTKQNYYPVDQSSIQNPTMANFQGALKGAPWKQIPLIFREKSGSILDTLNYNSTQDMRQMGYDYGVASLNQSNAFARQNYKLQMQGLDLQEEGLRQQNAKNVLSTALGVGAGIAAVALAAPAAGAVGAGAAAFGAIPSGAAMMAGGASIIGSASNYMFGSKQQQLQQQQLDLQRSQATQSLSQNLQSSKLSLAQLSEQYNAQRALDKMNFAFSQNVVMPTIFFSYNSDVIRDFCGNGGLVWRTYYSDYDSKRISILLNAFGMYHRTELRKELFTNVTTNFFTYFEAGSITVGGTDYYYDYPDTDPGVSPPSASTPRALPRWAVQSIILQLQHGVRVWHTKGPKPIGHSYYYENMVNYKAEVDNV